MTDLDVLFKSETELTIQWFTGKKCNLNCEFCFDSFQHKNLYETYTFQLDRVIPFIESFNKKVLVTFTGGEPMLSKNIVEFISFLTKNGHIVNIHTNLTTGITKLVEMCNIPRMSIGVSIHIKELEKNNLIETFIKNYHILKNANPLYLQVFEVADVNSYSHEDIIKYKKYFNDNGIEFGFTPMRISKNGAACESYEYTEKELQMFNLGAEEILIHKPDQCFNKKCTAGYKYIIVQPDNEVYPCLSIKNSMGNILTNNIVLNKEPIKCCQIFCECPYFVEWAN
jgi:MoaA/NifB/PqqE/SkfB family radical SAM enzyme